jgi:hypothetical protein
MQRKAACQPPAQILPAWRVGGDKATRRGKP